MAPDFAGQMHQVMQNIKAVLDEAGTSMDRIMKSTVFLTHMSDFQEMNDIDRSYFTEGNFPARTTIEAPLAVTGMLLEIECVADLCKAPRSPPRLRPRRHHQGPGAQR